MATLFAVFAILIVGLYAHHARLGTRAVFAICSGLLALGVGADLMIDQPPSRFDLN